MNLADKTDRHILARANRIDSGWRLTNDHKAHGEAL